MKSVAASILVTLIMVGGAAVGGYVVLPQLISKATAPTAAEVERIRADVLELQKFAEEERRAKRAAALPGDADISVVIQQVNGILERVANLETSASSFEEALNGTRDQLRTSLDATASSFLGEIAAVREEITAAAAGVKEAREARLRLIMERLDTLDAYFVVENVRTHLLKAKSDLLAQNFGNASAEIRKARALFGTLEISSVWKRDNVRSAANRIAQLERDIREDPATGVTRIDLLWSDLGRVLRPEQVSAPAEAPMPGNAPDRPDVP